MVGDLAGFAAAIYMRGIRFIQVPTTLLAMVDSSVGGKTGMNMTAGKNLVGAFHQPEAVIADSDFLRTLPEREIGAGIAEIIKHGVLADKDYFEELERDMEKLRALDPETVAEVVGRSCEIKAGVVEGTFYDAEGMKAIASVPSREVLLSKLLGSLQSPLSLIHISEPTRP